MKVRDRIVIGWLDPGTVDTEWCLSMMDIYQKRASNLYGLVRVGCSGLLSKNRNQVVKQFLDDTPAEWLFMIDTDERISLEAYDKLIASVHDVDRPFVAGLYFGAWKGNLYPTPVPLIFADHPGENVTFDSIHDYPKDQIIEVASAGTGCMLVHRKVFEAIRAGVPEHEKSWGWFRDGPIPGDNWLSEDHYFCLKAREAGFKVHAHTGVILDHHKQFWLGAEHHASYRKFLESEAGKL